MQETSLQSKTIHELRSIAEGYSVTDIFSKDRTELIQAVIVKQTDLQPKPKVKLPPKSEYDSRLMTKRPAKVTEQGYAVELLGEHINRGLVLTFPDPDRWHMRYKEKEDTGTLRMPPRVLLSCADKIIR